MNCVIEPGSGIRLYFSLALSDGQVIDSNFNTEPAEFCLGDGSMLPGFEAQLLGKGSGDEISVTLPPEQAFGEWNAANLQHFHKDKFNQLLDDEFARLEKGAVIAFKDMAGFDISGVVTEKYDTSVGVDFNHPLAGKAIVFRAKVLTVTAPDAQGLSFKY